MLCASIISFDSTLNFPFLPQPHFEGSLNFESCWRTGMILAQDGHSKRADITCGLTSDFCLTTPSIVKRLPICSDRISRIMIRWDLGRFDIRICIFFAVSGTSKRSTAISNAFMVSSESSSRASLRSRLNSAISLKSKEIDFSPRLDLSRSSGKEFFLMNSMNLSIIFFASILLLYLLGHLASMRYRPYRCCNLHSLFQVAYPYG